MGARARYWQSREERTAELRKVLDAAAEHLSSAIQAIAEANEHLRAAGFDPTLAEKFKQAARRRMSDAMTAQNGIWSTHNRLRLRTGSDSEVAAALADAEKQVGLLGAFVRRKLVTSDLLGYDEAWARAAAAEKAFYDAAANQLAVPDRGPQQLPRPTGIDGPE